MAGLITYSICAFAGLTLFVIGVIGITGMRADPIDSLTILLEPMGFGRGVDEIYWLLLGLLGIWLTLWMQVRVPATLALILIFLKIAVLKGFLALAITILLCLLLTVILVQHKESRHGDDGDG